MQKKKSLAKKCDNESSLAVYSSLLYLSLSFSPFSLTIFFLSPSSSLYLLLSPQPRSQSTFLFLSYSSVYILSLLLFFTLSLFLFLPLYLLFLSFILCFSLTLLSRLCKLFEQKSIKGPIYQIILFGKSVSGLVWLISPPYNYTYFIIVLCFSVSYLFALVASNYCFMFTSIYKSRLGQSEGQNLETGETTNGNLEPQP